MRPVPNLAVVCCVAAIALPALASVATLGPTNQNILLTGLGAGQYRVTWGSCVFSGGITTCTVTAPFTGVGNGGTVAFVLVYQGNGLSPLTTGSQVPGQDQLLPFSLSSGSFAATFTENNGTVLTFYGQAPFFTFNTIQCTGLPAGTCSVGQVGLTANSTVTGPVSGSFDTTPVIQSSGGVISASSYGAFQSIAPATWIEIYGRNLATTTVHTWDGLFNGNNAPTSIVGTAVTVGGVPAYLYYVSPSQINAQVPSTVATGRQPVVVTTGAEPVFLIAFK